MPDHWRRRWLIAVVCLVLSPFVSAPARAAAPDLTMRLPLTTVGYATDGIHVAWSEREPAALYAAAFADGRRITIASLDQQQLYAPDRFFEVGGGLVAWIEPHFGDDAHQLLLVHDLAAGGRVEIARSTQFSLSLVAVKDGHIVWRDSASGDRRQLWVRDARAQKPARPVLPPEVSELGSAVGHVLWADRYTVWEETYALDGRPAGRLRWLHHGRLHTAAAPTADGARWMGLLGDTLYLSYVQRYRLQPSRTTLWALDLRDGRLRPIFEADDNFDVVAADDRYLLWWRPEHYWKALWAFDTLTGVRYMVLQPPHETQVERVTLGHGRRLVVQRHPDPDSPGIRLEARQLPTLTPTKRQAPIPGSTDYFPETGHQLDGSFANFWRASGGLPVFGYPLTGQFQQIRPGATDFASVQWFERQRLEYRSEKAGTPYEVELGRLGAEDAARREELRGLWAFNPAAAGADHPAGCRHLADAGHRLCGEFRPHWEGHGLEFGDAGVSFRESVALFGYPISEEFIDPKTGLITQYFERAVFEYHPEQPPGARVLLRRLGAEELTRVGWLPAPGE